MPFMLLLLGVFALFTIHAAIIQYKYWKRRKDCATIAEAHGVLDKYEKYMAIEDPCGQLTPDVALEMALDRRWSSDQIIDIGEPCD